MIRDEGIGYITEAIQYSNVVSLNLSTNALTNKGLEKVIMSVIPNQTIIDLNISSN
jgi:hypothetical protein